MTDRLTDLGRLLLALGLGDYARPLSPAETFGLCILEAERIRLVNADLLAQLKHAVHWHDQINAADVARYEAVIAKASPREGSDYQMEAAE